MENFDYSAHVTFVMLNNSPVPWHVVFTSARPPFTSYVLGTDVGQFWFVYDDIVHNAKVDHFPRPKSLQLDGVAKFDDMENLVRSFYKLFQERNGPGNWDVVVGAVDPDTYWYLKKIIDKTILLGPTLKGIDHTLCAVYRKQEYDKAWNHVEYVEEKKSNDE